MNALTILAVDDEPANLAILHAALHQQYRMVYARSGAEAEDALLRHHPDMVLLDIGLPDTDGVALCRRLKSLDTGKAVRIIFITSYRDADSEAAGFEAGCVDYIFKPVSPPLVRARVAAQLAQVRASALERSHRDAILMLAHAGHYNDSDTGAHIWRMAAYARVLALACGWDVDDADQLELAAPMHDTGKLGIPHAILRKPGPLDAAEWAVMRTHPAIGHAILSQSQAPLFQLAAQVALRHHERWDGGGYPDGLRGEAIPLAARIVTLADVFDALSMRRPYKAPWSMAQITAYINDNSGVQFDPALVRCFMTVLPALLEIKARWDNLDASAAPRGLPQL
ncbi:HD domain-containing phosphohydrolase [Massilia sp. PWRC2]|uniref:HD domain-containing phosphohydrolase n=1 Tax=Massilia sp. PWRC2 TaxID=2804626 RepID=UPI003CF9A1F0